jgi:transketolase
MTISTLLGYDELPRLLTLQTGDEKHDRSSHSTLDVLWVLYDRVLDADDRFLLSKGHGPSAYYAVLAAKGFIPVDVLSTFGAFDSPLGNHPDRVLAPGVGLSSGSLGHGLPIAVGRALAAPRVFVLVGDGELDEGSNWEAVQYAGRIALANLTVVAVDNDSSSYGWPDGIERRFELEGWSVTRTEGRDHDALERAFDQAPDDRPHLVVAEVLTRG